MLEKSHILLINRDKRNSTDPVGFVKPIKKKTNQRIPIKKSYYKSAIIAIYDVIGLENFEQVFAYRSQVILQPSRLKSVQSQQNNVRTTFTERCSDIIFLTLNRFLLAVISNSLKELLGSRENNVLTKIFPFTHKSEKNIFFKKEANLLVYK